MMRKRSPYGHQRHNNNNRNGGGQMRRHHRRDGNSNNTQYEQHDDEHVSPRQRRHAQIQREKYVNMAIDARRSGDRVQAEYWLQHADHYQRILNVAQEQYVARGAQMEDSDEGQDAGGMSGGEASGSNYQQQSQNDGFSAEGGMEDDAYEPSYGTPAPQEQPRRQQHQGGGQRRNQHQQRRPRHEQQDRAEVQGGLEDVLPMPKPERSDQRFDQDEE